MKRMDSAFIILTITAILGSCAQPSDTGPAVVAQTASRQGTKHIARLVGRWADTMGKAVADSMEKAAVEVAELQEQDSGSDGGSELPDFTQDNREIFDSAVEMLELSASEAEECFQILCGDDVR